MKQFGAFEAKNRLGHLLDLVEQGEEVIITRHGKPVARMVRSDPAFDRSEAIAAMERIIERGKDVSLGELKIKDLVEEGRE